MSEQEPLPDLGLPLYGLRTWMLGARVLAFDVTALGKLELRVEDRVLRRFPTGAEGDSDELLAEVRAEWDELRPRARATVKRARAALRAAMRTGRRWSRAEFDAEVRAHPVLRRLASRLVWAGLDEAGQAVSHGRLMLHGEWDLGPGRPNGLSDEVVAIMLPESADLPERVRASWSARFSKQPIAQLSVEKEKG
jgi:hypothetical protein